ncbi:uncharacterized protein FYW61_000429 [Anableps anableps]
MLFNSFKGNSATGDQTAYVGDSVSITCNYSQAHKSSIRYFCRHDGNFSCTNIISVKDLDYAKLSKFSLRDDKQRGLYQVNMSMLTQEDTGKYWCALKRDNSIICLKEVFLHVLRMIAGIVCAVIIVVVLILVLILCKRKLFNRRGGATEQKTNTAQNTERDDRDHQNEEIQMQNKQENTVCTLYSTVNPPADQLHYASINIQSGEPTGNDENTSSVPNNSLKGTAHSPAETTLYSTVVKHGE